MASSNSSQASPSQAEPRLCWICQQDETEDPTPTTVWKSPCPCSLTAHDTCLLEWISSQEHTKKDETAYNKRIQCPQCQSTINIERPHDYLVQAYTSLHGAVGACAMPAALSGVLGCVYSGFLVYGINTLQLVFGHGEADRMLSMVYPRPSLATKWLQLTRETLRWSLTAFDPFFPEIQTNADWRVFIGLPLIGPCLILSRTKFADQALPLMLPLYFLNPYNQQLNLRGPLTPGITFAALPYLRAAYNEAYKHIVAPYEKKWDLAVMRKPREGETAADIAAQAQDDDGPLIEIQVVEEIIDEEGEVAGDLEAVRQRLQLPVPENPEGVVQEDHNQEINGQQPPPGAPGAPPPQAQIPNDNENWQIRQDIPLRQVMTTTMGALFFPTVASFSGELLKYTLPSRLVSKHVGNRSLGWGSDLLREKWGRTIVGGCLFVFLKDAVTLYVKWKRARDFGKRKILDYTGPSRRVS